RITRPMVGPRSQAPTRQVDQLGFGAAGAQAVQGAVQLSPSCLVSDRPGVATHIRRTAGQDFAKDGAEPKDIGTLVHLLEVPSRLLGCHVVWCAQDRSRPRDPGI